MREEREQLLVQGSTRRYIDKKDTKTDRHTKHHQELDLAKMERREYASIKVK